MLAPTWPSIADNARGSKANRRADQPNVCRQQEACPCLREAVQLGLQTQASGALAARQEGRIAQAFKRMKVPAQPLPAPQCMHLPEWTLASIASKPYIMFRSSLQALLLDSGSALAHQMHAAATPYRSARFLVQCTLHASDWIRKARAVPDCPDA